MKKKSGMEKFTPDARIEEFLKTPLKKEIPKTPLTEEEKNLFLREIYTQEPTFTSRNNLSTFYDWIRRQIA